MPRPALKPTLTRSPSGYYVRVGLPGVGTIAIGNVHLNVGWRYLAWWVRDSEGRYPDGEDMPLLPKDGYSSEEEAIQKVTRVLMNEARCVGA